MDGVVVINSTLHESVFVQMLYMLVHTDIHVHVSPIVFKARHLHVHVSDFAFCTAIFSTGWN